MSGTPRCCNTLRSTPLGNLDPVIRLFEGIFLTASANLIRNREFHVDYLGHAQRATLGTPLSATRQGATGGPGLGRVGPGAAEGRQVGRDCGPAVAQPELVHEVLEGAALTAGQPRGADPRRVLRGPVQERGDPR